MWLGTCIPKVTFAMNPAENKQLGEKKIENSSSWFAFQSKTIIAYTHTTYLKGTYSSMEASR